MPRHSIGHVSRADPGYPGLHLGPSWSWRLEMDDYH